MLNDDVKKRIESGIENTQCYVNEFSGGTDHYSVIVISDAFEGMNSLKRHRTIMALFKNEIDTGEVHALTIKAFTTQQWQQEKHKYVSKSNQ